MYYVISIGLHPFGDVLRHQANITIGEYKLTALEKDGMKKLIISYSSEIAGQLNF